MFHPDKSPTNIQTAILTAHAVNPDNPVLADLQAAQAILESNLANKPSRLALDNNNYFGIKGKGSAGSKTYSTNEEVNGKTVNVKAEFAANETMLDSFRQHSSLIQRRYKSAANAKTFEEAAIAVTKGGYATDSEYVSKLLAVYEKHVVPNKKTLLAEGKLNSDDTVTARAGIDTLNTLASNKNNGKASETKWITNADRDAMLAEFFRALFADEKKSQEVVVTKEEGTGVFGFIAKVVGSLSITAFVAGIFGSSSTDGADTVAHDNTAASTPSPTNLAAFTPKLASLPVAEAAQGASVTAPNASSTEKVAQTGGLGVASGS
jgi:hypothetical protein